MSVYDILILTAVAGLLALAVVYILRRRKKGGVCGGDCSHCVGCAYRDAADEAKEKRRP